MKIIVAYCFLVFVAANMLGMVAVAVFLFPALSGFAACAVIASACCVLVSVVAAIVGFFVSLIVFLEEAS